MLSLVSLLRPRYPKASEVNYQALKPFSNPTASPDKTTPTADSISSPRRLKIILMEKENVRSHVRKKNAAMRSRHTKLHHQYEAKAGEDPGLRLRSVISA